MFKHGGWLAVILLILILLMTSLNLFGIFTYPKPDSGAFWIHDETWSVTLVRNAITNGKSCHDTAIESSIESTYPLILGEHWIYVGVYGVPMLITSHFSVEAARLISFALGILVLLAAFYLLQRLHNNLILSLLGLLIIASSTSFVLASHCARYDLLTGLYLLALFYFISSPGKQFFERKSKAFAFGAYVGCSPFVSYHAAGMILFAVLALHIVLVCRYRLKYLTLPTNLLFVLGVCFPLLLTLCLSLAGIGNEISLLKFISGGEYFRGEHKFVLPVLLSSSPREIINQVAYQFLDFFGHNTGLMILGISLVSAICSNVLLLRGILKDFRITMLLTVMIALFVFYLLYRPAWATYTVFLLPIETVLALSIFSVWLDSGGFDFRFGYLFIAVLTFTLAINENVRVLEKKYDRDGLAKSLMRFEEIIQRFEGHRRQIVLADGRLFDFLDTRGDLKYVNDMSMMFPSPITTTADAMMKRQGIRYVVELSTANLDNSRENAISINFTCSAGKQNNEMQLLEETTGIFEDAERDYHRMNTWYIPDTLRLWKTAY